VYDVHVLFIPQSLLLDPVVKLLQTSVIDSDRILNGRKVVAIL
jgi:hypothetical protein